MTAWFLYIVRCKNGSLYTGITTDVEARVAAHNAGKGAKYTRAFGPVVLVFKQKVSSITVAKKTEALLKKLSKKEKELIIIRGKIPAYETRNA